MRYILIIAILYPGNVYAESTGLPCGKLAPAIAALADAAADAEKTTRNGDFSVITENSRGTLKQASEKAQAARNRVAAALREYRAATEDLAYQLRVCAR